MVAGCVVSPNTAMRLNLDPRQREELFQCICQMAVQCAVKGSLLMVFRQNAHKLPGYYFHQLFCSCRVKTCRCLIE